MSVLYSHVPIGAPANEIAAPLPAEKGFTAEEKTYLDQNLRFTDDDIALVERIGQRQDYFPRCPDIITNFQRYIALAPEDRMNAALADLHEKTLRTGYIIEGLPKPESVFEHSMRLQARVDHYAPAAASETFKAHLKLLAEVHDLPEALIGDFPPNQIIASSDKKQLEGLAARLIFVGDAERYAAYQEYEAKSTFSAQLMSDIDKIDALEMALVYEGRYPDNQHIVRYNDSGSNGITGMYETFKANSVERIKTDFGKYLLKELDKSAEQIRASAAPKQGDASPDSLPTSGYFSALIENQKNANNGMPGWAM